MAAPSVTLIKLLIEAEKLLIKAGQTDPLTRLTTLRGIYYGTTWSLDFKVEKSQVRSHGFYLFTGGQDPIDARPILGQKLFTALQQSQDVSHKNVKFDFGHLLIGADARKKKSSRTLNVPFMGGTGLEIVTWLGDLGGGAANLAFNRLNNPKLTVQHVFKDSTSDYGASINLEGDIAAYIVGIGFPIPGETYIPTSITHEIEKYLPLKNTTIWDKRALFFLTGIGGKFQQKKLLNRLEVIGSVASKIEDFSAYYFIQRYVLGGLVDNQKTNKVCTMLPGISFEVAAVFVDALIFCLANASKPLSGRPPFPPISNPAKQCNIGVLSKVLKLNNLKSKIESLEEITSGAVNTLFKKIEF